MFVRYRQWSDSRDAWAYGKTHWMARPWRTECGMYITDTWLLHYKYERGWTENGCKKCGL